MASKKKKPLSGRNDGRLRCKLQVAETKTEEERIICTSRSTSQFLSARLIAERMFCKVRFWTLEIPSPANGNFDPVRRVHSTTAPFCFAACAPTVSSNYTYSSASLLFEHTFGGHKNNNIDAVGDKTEGAVHEVMLEPEYFEIICHKPRKFQLRNRKISILGPRTRSVNVGSCSSRRCNKRVSGCSFT